MIATMRACLGLLVLALASTKQAIAYTIDASTASLSMFDSRTGVRAFTLFYDEASDAILNGLQWKDGLSNNSSEVLNYRTFVNGDKVHEGFLALPEDPLELPAQINAGTIFSMVRGKTTVEVEFWIDGEMNDSVSIEIQTFQKWMASIPMMVILGLGFVRDLHVIYTLLIGLFVGGCMITGSFIDGFKSIITRYIITAASNEQHVYLYTFSLVVAGLAAMIRRSGGVSAVVQRVSQFSGSLILGQLMVFVAGIVLFMDPYASIIFICELVSPYFRLFPVSLEKYAFLIQSTGVPVASINPLSTWVGFSSSLIQAQLDRLVEMGYEDLTLPDDGWSIFVKSIKYQFYPIFLLCFVPIMIVSKRDLGPMLIAERERWLFVESGEVTKWTLREKISRPDASTPRLARNMWIPVVFWSISIWLAFAFLSDTDSEDNATDFTAALIYCTFGAAAVTQIFYLMQRLEIEPENGDRSVHQSVVSAFRTMNAPYNRRPSMGGKGAANADYILKNLQNGFSADAADEIVLSTDDGSPNMDEIEAALEQLVSHKVYKALVPLKDGAHCFFKGGATVMPVLMTLTLAWATTDLFLELGMGRLFADLINRGNIKLEMYPTIGFFVSFLIALTTGSSMAAQSMVIPLLAFPLYAETDGKEELFYAMVGAVFSGSVVGDQASPLSTSSILSSIMIECDLRDHMLSQAPHVIFIAFLSVFVGHIPTGFDNYPYYIGYALGFVLLCCYVLFCCVDVLDEAGRYDFITSYFVSGRFASGRLKTLQDRICMANGIEIVEIVEDLALDTESASEAPSYDPADAYDRITNEKIQMQVEVESDDESDDDESSASASMSSGSSEESTEYSRQRRPSRPPVESNSGRSSRSVSQRVRATVNEQSAPERSKRSASPSQRSARTTATRSASPSRSQRSQNASQRSARSRGGDAGKLQSSPPSQKATVSHTAATYAEPGGRNSPSTSRRSQSPSQRLGSSHSRPGTPKQATSSPAPSAPVKEERGKDEKEKKTSVLKWLGNAIDDDETTFGGADSAL